MPAATPDEVLVLARYGRARIGAVLGAPAPAEPEGVVYAAPGAAFVSLHWSDGRLQGCIGSLEAVRPLVLDVARNAEAAAFRDPRASRLRPGDEAALSVEVSVLSPLEPVAASEEAGVLAALRPGIDGVLLCWRHHRATFIPQMWTHFAEPGRLLAELKQKAGLPSDFWAPDVAVSRYTATIAVDPAPSGA